MRKRSFGLKFSYWWFLTPSNTMVLGLLVGVARGHPRFQTVAIFREAVSMDCSCIIIPLDTLLQALRCLFFLGGGGGDGHIVVLFAPKSEAYACYLQSKHVPRSTINTLPTKLLRLVCHNLTYVANIIRSPLLTSTKMAKLAR